MFAIMRKKLASRPVETADAIRKAIIARYEEIGRNVAKRFVRGDVNIKAGRIITKRDLAKRKGSGEG